MESSVIYTIEKAWEEFLREVDSFENISIEEVEDLRIQIERIKNKNCVTEKINLYLFGNANSGKTSSINLLLKFFANSLGSCYDTNDMDEGQTNPLIQRYTEVESFQLVSNESENTFFYYIIESSESEYFRLFMKLSEKEKEVFASCKSLAPFIKTTEPKEFLIDEIFPNTQAGIGKLNSLMLLIDKISSDLIEQSKKEEDEEFQPESFQPHSYSLIPFVKIQIPNFPKKYRFIDTPQLDPQKFSYDLLKITDDDFNSFNIFIFVNEISCRTMYNIEWEILNQANNDGQPLFYSFYTKGLNFIEKLKNTEKKNKKQAKIDREKYLNINRLYFERLKSLKEKGFLFRGIIPIIDNDLENNEVRRKLKLFMDDVDKLISGYYQDLFENNELRKLYQLIIQLNNRLSMKDLFAQDEIQLFENKKK